MKIKKIVSMLLVLVMISGCSKAEPNITPTPTITPSETPIATKKPEPTKKPTPTPTPIVVEQPIEKFDINDWDVEYIAPLLFKGVERDDDYFSLYDDHYIFVVDGKYGIINDQQQIVLNPIGTNYPIVHAQEGANHLNWNIIDQSFGTYYEIQDQIKNSKLNICDGHGSCNQDLVYDMNKNAFLYKYNSTGGPSAALLDFDTTDYPKNSLLRYQELYSVKEKENEYEELVTIFDVSGKYGIADTEGNKITEAIYHNVFDIESELIPVSKEGLWGYVDKNGEEVIPIIYYDTFFERNEKMSYYPYPYPVVNGRIVVKNWDNKYGVIDIWGNTLIEFEYDQGSPYYDNSVILKKDGEWFIK